MTETELLKGVIDRLKEEGQLTRNSGSHSIKSVKEAMLSDLPSKLKDSILSSRDDAIVAGTSTPVPSAGDDLETKRDERLLFEQIRDSLQTIAENTSGGVGAAASSGGGGLGSTLSGAGSGLGAILKGFGGGVGLAGLGIGAAFAGGALLVNQVTELMKSFDDLADGIEKLNDTPVSIEQFEKIGSAINALVSGTSIGGAIGLRILQGTAFSDLADGITELNNVRFDPVQLENVAQGLSSLVGSTGIISSGGFALLAETDFKSLAEGLNALGAITVDPTQLALVGEGINAMLEPLSVTDLGEASVIAAIDDNLDTVANAVAKINGLNIDGSFVDRMAFIGEGINAMLEPLSVTDLGEAAVLQVIDDNLPAIADGVRQLNTVDGNLFATQGALLGQGFSSLLDGMDDLLGAVGIELIDDNLGAVADGVKYFSSIVTPEIASGFNNQAIMLGHGFQALLDGTDDLFGATGMQMIDDNIMPVADGVRYFTDIVTPEVAKSFMDTSVMLGTGFQALLDGTDDLFGATGMQMIDDNLAPLADAIERLNEVGTGVDLNNFYKMRAAVNEVQGIANAIAKISFAETLSEGTLDLESKLDELHNAVGKTRESSKYIEGIEPERKPRSEMTAYERKMDRMDRTEERLARSNSTPQTSRGQELTDKSKENALSKGVSVNVVNAPTSQNVTNNSQSTAAIMDKNMPTVDYNDRTWAFG